ncbi:MAG: CoA transferase [Actinobacteria bacterium]|nr:CoA transferase [Actinomycetota bacterium]
MSARGLLVGVKVVDLARVLAGPFAARVLAEMGADVVKVEFPNGDPARTIGPHLGARSLYFSSLNSGKRGVCLDPGAPGGRAALEALLAGADVAVTNFKHASALSLGLDAHALLERHERLIAVAVAGYAHDDERADEGVFDVTAQAESGIMSVTGTPGGPPIRAGVALSDLAAGMWAALGAAAALYARERDGRGRAVEVPLIDATLPLLAYVATSALGTGVEPPPVGAGHHSLCPYGAWPALDGWIVIAVLADKFWPPLCATLGLDGLAGDPALATNAGRFAARPRVDAAIGSALAEVTVQEAIEGLRAAGVPSAPVLGVLDALTSPYVQRRGIVATVDAAQGPYRVAQGPLWDRAPVRPAPALGEHSEEVLAELLGRDSPVIGRVLDEVHARTT